ncbi:hypothetical protein C0Q70_17402 [Pomacea canaliculata]|uniref:Uncharacterized protein n=1 Tax=Pomacea canaliculata TaxID=400727 RepID=A0A2T7NKA9_POMCA|nr:hypothetical protein C0Q70_17402 [Pomacea canaliculata]
MRRLLILVAMVLLISGTCMSAPQPLDVGNGMMSEPRHGLLSAPSRKVLGKVRKDPGVPLSGAIMRPWP